MHAAQTDPHPTLEALLAERDRTAETRARVTAEATANAAAWSRAEAIDRELATAEARLDALRARVAADTRRREAETPPARRALSSARFFTRAASSLMAAAVGVTLAALAAGCLPIVPPVPGPSGVESIGGSGSGSGPTQPEPPIGSGGAR